MLRGILLLTSWCITLFFAYYLGKADSYNEVMAAMDNPDRLNVDLFRWVTWVMAGGSVMNTLTLAADWSRARSSDPINQERE